MNWNITAGRPVYVQLVEQLELALVAGEFPPGSRIPPVRELAADAGVNPNTMQRALQELESRGLLQAQRTAGRTVTADDAALHALRRRRADGRALPGRRAVNQRHANQAYPDPGQCHVLASFPEKCGSPQRCVRPCAGGACAGNQCNICSAGRC